MDIENLQTQEDCCDEDIDKTRLPPSIVDYYDEALFRFGDYSLKELIAVIYPEARAPQDDSRLRIRFWDEYDACFLVDPPRRMLVQNIVRGVCPKRNFIQRLQQNPDFFAFITRRPVGYKTGFREIADLGLEEMRHIMTLPLEFQTSKGKRINTGLARLKVDVFKWLHEQEHGLAVQRTMNLNVTAGEGPRATPESMKEIEAKLAELRGEERQALPPGEVRPSILEIERDVKNVDVYVPVKGTDADDS